MNYKEATEKLINQLYKDIRLDHLKIELLKDTINLLEKEKEILKKEILYLNEKIHEK